MVLGGWGGVKAIFNFQPAVSSVCGFFSFFLFFIKKYDLGVFSNPQVPQFICSCHQVSITGYNESDRKTESRNVWKGSGGEGCSLCAAPVFCAEGSIGVQGFLLLALRFR